MSLLSTLVPQLKRFVAVAGQFDALFPDTTNNDLIGALADGYAEAQLSGFFSTGNLDLTTNAVTPDLNPAQGSLVVLFSGTRMLQAEIRNRKSHTRYEAGPVTSEVDYSSQVLTELLKQYQAEKKEIVLTASRYGSSDAIFVADAYVERVLAWGRGTELDYAGIGRW